MSGPFHFRAPSRIFYKAIRGMIPHKTARGAAALERLKVFEGVPPPYDKKKKMVVPQALRVLRLQPGRKYCTVGRLSHENGWKYQDVVSRYVLSKAAEFNMCNSSLTVPTVWRTAERPRPLPTTSARRLPHDNCPTPRRTLAPRPRRPRLSPPSATRRRPELLSANHLGLSLCCLEDERVNGGPWGKNLGIVPPISRAFQLDRRGGITKGFFNLFFLLQWE